MKFALFLVLSMSALAIAGPAFTNKNNQIQQQQQQDAYNKQQQQYMTVNAGEEAKSQAVQILKQWCFASQMSQQELTASFKKLVSVVKSNPIDQITESAVMGERICQGALVAKSQQTGETISQGSADAKAHELIKDVYMDAMISCKSHECTQQLLKTIESEQVDSIRASYYMTRIAVTDKQEIKDEQEVKQLAESFLGKQQHQSEAVERQQLFATTSLIGKWISQKPTVAGERSQVHQVAEQVIKAIVERYIKPVSQQQVEQYKQAEQGELSPELAKKIAKRSAALKALANIPGHVIKSCPEVEEILVELAQNKKELSTVRQSAIECLEQNDKQIEQLKQLTFDEEEPIEVRVAAYRALMTSLWSATSQQASEQEKQKQAEQLVGEIIKHCEQKQQQDEQFVLYAVSHLDNVRTSQQPELQAIKSTISENKQHFMQIQLLAKKLKQQLSDVRRSSRNYKLEQEYNQVESGFIVEGDLIYASQQKKSQQQMGEILPKLVRVNMSMPVMGETVNVIEITLRQDNMDEELLGALKMVQNTKFNQQTVTKVVDSFKQTAERQQSGNKQTQGKHAEADLTIKVDGRTIVYVSLDDFKYATEKKTAGQQTYNSHQRNTRSIYQSGSIVDEIIEYLRREPVSFNRGFNFNIQERIAKVLDIDVNVLAGMRFESRAEGHSKKDFEIVAQMEPRFAFEAITGPAKMSAKKLLQRFSTKTALGLRLRFKEQELVDVELNLPMNTMELFTFETQIVEKNVRRQSGDSHADTYSYLPESIYGQEDIYASYPIYSSPEFATVSEKFVAKRSIVPSFVAGKKSSSTYSQLIKNISNKGAFSHSYETSLRVARATGLVGKLRMIASPKDMSFLVSAIVEKHEPQMRGYRVKIEQTGGRTASDLKSYTITMMTPGSQIDRTMQVRLTKQTSSARTLIKSEIQSPVMGAVSFSCELVHDGRQYSVKSELVSRSRQQWRHLVEFGVVQGPSASTSGRLAHFNYKPFLQINSTALKRPIAMQGQIAYVESPKAVISYELKCPNTGDFIQGKLIFDARDNKMSSSSMRKRSSTSFRRSMQSPLELIASQDLTLTSEFLAQLANGKHAIKSHQMIDWDCQKLAIEANSQVSHKNLRKQTEQQLVAQMKVDGEQQVFTIERKCPQEQRKQWAVRLVSQVRPTGHQMNAECRYNGRRGQQEVVAYKHKMDVAKLASNKYECAVELELVDSSRQFNEKLSGRVRLVNERKQKQCQLELNGSRSTQAKLNVDFESLAKHLIQLTIANERFAHKCEMRNNERQFALVSRTEKPNTKEQLVKVLVEIEKQISPLAAKIVVEVPVKRCSIAADVKLASGKRSSFAVQTPRFASQAEFTFDLKDIVSSSRRSFYPFQRAANLRFRSNLKDLANKQAYWMDSQLNGADLDQESFLRLDSPYYRTELAFSPRDQEAKLAAFARSSRPQNQFDSIYRTEIEGQKSSLIDQIGSFAQEKLSLGPSKMWMLRSIVKSPFAREQLKKEARRALFEYADRRQSHKHSLEWSPEDERVNMELVREPNTEFVKSTTFEPLRLKADFSTEMSRPSTMQLESEWMSADVEAKPFGHYAGDNQESYAKVSALSRHPRSAFKKHDSEIRYNKHSGYKAHMKHVDSKDKRHQMALEADRQPQKYAKLAYDSDKHGKTSWEHKWRQQQEKRALDQEDIFSNKMFFKREGPIGQKSWAHETKFDWEEPSRMTLVGGERRYRRSIFSDKQTTYYSPLAALYQPIEYLKNTQARLQSTYTPDMDMTSSTGAVSSPASYKLDFDYKPLSNVASMAYEMPEEMSHFSQVEIKPAERLYKLQSKLYNRRTQEPTYELLAATKPFYGPGAQPSAEMNVDKLASSEQEAVFVHSSHPMLERPISRDSLVYQLFKQPMKLDYSDKYGRVANFDYDQLLAVEDAARQQQQQKLATGGLRQKRAILSFKDPMAEIEHSSTYDFYPETYMTQINKSQYQRQMMAPVALKTHTKYGPIIVRADSTDSAVLIDLESPIVSAKIVGETGANLRTLYKMQLDNKSQRVQLAKLLREAPEMIRECKPIKKFVRKFDSNKFEQQAELLVSIVDQIFKVKTSTKVNERPVCVIEGEWNEQTGKAYAKINGERVEGQAIVDLVRKTADLTLEVDNKRTLNHITRLVKVSDKFYSLESMTYHKSRPLFKLAGQVSAKVFDLEHLLESSSYERRQSQSFDAREHLSTFEAVVYEPKELHVTGQFDCDKKEARIVIKNVEEQRVQETHLRFEPQTETIFVSAELNSKHEGQVYKTQAKISLPGLYQSDKCQAYNQTSRGNKYISKYAMNKYPTTATATTFGAGNQGCSSEFIYSDNKSSGIYAAKYYPGEYVQVQSPRSGKTTFNLAY